MLDRRLAGNRPFLTASTSSHSSNFKPAFDTWPRVSAPREPGQATAS
jgi:hypothetical protein